MEIGLALFIVTIIVNALARLLVWAVTRGAPAQRNIEETRDGLGRAGELLELRTNTSFAGGYGRLTDGAATGLAVLATVLVVAPLVAIFVYLIYKGAVR
jgi:hypothetical protein